MIRVFVLLLLTYFFVNSRLVSALSPCGLTPNNPLALKMSGKRLKATITKSIKYSRVLATLNAEPDILSQTLVSKKDSLILSAVPPPNTNPYVGSTTFYLQGFILPTMLIGYGVFGLTETYIRTVNIETHNEVIEDLPQNLVIDNYTQYMPMVSVYALNAMGVKGLHNFRERTLILSTAYLLMGTTVLGLKNTIHNFRPDHSNANSFPSGHTATAFMGAEFLRMEYSEVSPWIGVTGYAVATFTGAMRITNDRHWVTDVTAGAGIGILSAQAAYWLYPWLNGLIFPKKAKISTSVVPYYSDETLGVGVTVIF